MTRAKGSLDWIQALTASTVLSISHNLFGGQLPPTLPPAVHSFLAANCSFTGVIPPAYATLPALRNLIVSFNQLKGPIPEMMQVERLDLRLVAPVAPERYRLAHPSCLWRLWCVVDRIH
jgi:hypothetical protein